MVTAQLFCLLSRYEEKQADIKSAKLFGTAEGLISGLRKVQNSNLSQGLPDGENPFDQLHPSIKDRISSLEPLAVPILRAFHE